MFRRFIAASILKLVTKISLAKLTPVKIPLAGLGIVFLAMGLPVFPAAALEVTMTLSDGDSNNAGANWTATVCYDTANQFEFNETPLFIRYFPAKMRFILEPDLSNVGIGDGGTIVHEEVRVVFELTADGPNFTVTNDVLEGWDGQLDGKVVSNVILKMNSSEDTQYDSFDLNSAFDFNPISFPPPLPATSPDFLGGANYTYSNGSATQGFDGTFYSFVEGETCPLDLEPTATEVEIDIKPGSDPNSINLCTSGIVSVAILTTSVADGDASDFDATTVDADTATLADQDVRTVGKSNKLMSRIEDVDGDGDLDQVLQFETINLALTLDITDTTATLNAETIGGDSVTGTDDIRIVKDCS